MHRIKNPQKMYLQIIVTLRYVKILYGLHYVKHDVKPNVFFLVSLNSQTLATTLVTMTEKHGKTSSPSTSFLPTSCLD